MLPTLPLTRRKGFTIISLHRSVGCETNYDRFLDIRQRSHYRELHPFGQSRFSQHLVPLRSVHILLSRGRYPPHFELRLLVVKDPNCLLSYIVIAERASARDPSPAANDAGVRTPGVDPITLILLSDFRAAPGSLLRKEDNGPSGAIG
jgi:hypothetical protein